MAQPTASAVDGGPAPNRAQDNITKLNPFEVAATPDKSYGALNSNSITQFKTELDKMPVTADIFDQKFMMDTDTTSVEGMLGAFSAGAGLASAAPDASAGSSEAGDRNANGTLSFRGLASTAIERDGFFPYNNGQQGQSAGTLYTPVFDLETVDVVYGPQSLLYGVGGGGGVVNYESKAARLGSPSFGSVNYRLDQYGNKTETLDYGAGGDRVAVRADLIDSSNPLGTRRVNIGGPFEGAYAQIAFKPLSNTIVRVDAEETTFTRYSNDNLTLTALSTANDARNGQHIHYLLATNQIDAAANGGASGAGVIDNGNINWGNVDSFAGWTNGEYTRNQWALATVDTVWTPWLSTRLAAGYDSRDDEKIGNSATAFDAPNVTANPTGTWAATISSAASEDLYEPSRTKSFRASAILTNDFFGDRAHSQTAFGGDYSRVDAATITEAYALADANGNPVNNGTATNNGLTLLPAQFWSVASGPVMYPFANGYAPRQDLVTFNGQTYVRTISNAPNPALISPNNPLGLTGTGAGDFRILKNMAGGVYFINNTSWFNDKLTSLVGARLQNTFAQQINEGSKAQPSVTAPQSSSWYPHKISYSAGLNYELLPWLRPYVEFSDSYNPPQTDQADPLGNYPVISTAVGEEAGFKFTNPDKSLSGSVALYHTNSKNEETSFTSTLDTDINPTGLNGKYGAPSQWVNVDRESQGVTLTFTDAPTGVLEGLRMRFSANVTNGTINSNRSYGQLYNDQFYENAAGQVTYADGTVVYINGAATTATAAKIVTASTAGAAPLTAALMSTQGSVYFANPSAINLAINPTSTVAKLLATVDPVHGSILTGAVGLPISMLQISPSAAGLLPPPGVIPVALSGDVSAGFPKYSFNYTAVYEFHGPLTGFQFGGSLAGYWKFSQFYYYPQSLSVNPLNRTMFYKPDEWTLAGIFGYTVKLKRITFSTRLNIANLFNHYHVFTIPNYVNGWAGPDDATFDVFPRAYTWSTTLAF